MKKLALFAALVVGVTAWAQGNVNLGNRVGPANIDAPVTDADGTKLLGPAFVAQLYAGTTQDSLSPVGSAIQFRSTTAGAGYFPNTSVSIPANLIADGKSWVKVGAWEAAGGASIEAAQAAGKKWGWSEVLQITPTQPPAAPADLVGLKAWQLIPEPSIMALGLLGATALLIRRRS